MRILRMIIQCETPLHCGGGMDDVLDQPVSRDAFGFWRIPGSSLAGSLRALAAAQNEKLARDLFGYQSGENSHASLVWCEDGRLLDYDNKVALYKCLEKGREAVKIKCDRPWVRDHVRLSLDHGTAKDGAKFDAEFVPAGARFLLEFRCDGWKKPLSAEQAAFFDSLCASALAGGLELGGKSGLGYGQYSIISHQYAEFDLKSRQGMEAWLNLEPEGEFPQGSKALPKQEAARQEQGEGLNGWLELPLVFNAPVLIGGGIAGENAIQSEADMLFALTPRLEYAKNEVAERLEPVLPASAIRGVIRHAIYGVLMDRGLGDDKATEILADIFGRAEGAGGQCGKIAFSDCRLGEESQPGKFQFTQHVAIDRFSAATITGALFSEQPFWKANAAARFRIRACGLAGHEAALLFHALLDLCAGGLAIGGGVNRGNGRPVLPEFQDNPQKALGALGGNLSWNGEAICANGKAFEQLQKLAPEWDRNLKERV